MSASWVAPVESRFVERLPELTKKGANRTKGQKHTLAPCDVCWEPTWIGDLTAKGHACRMTPKCPGRHRREGLIPALPAGVDLCAMCREREATCIAVHDHTGDRWPSCRKCRAQATRYRSPITFEQPQRAEEAA